MQQDTKDRGSFKSRWGFIMAAAGSAVGLGNIWKFPYITGENGGGLFVLIYLVCIALVGLPIMVAEIMIGRAAQKQPVVAFEQLQGKKTGWSLVGWLGMACGFVILSYYIVVAGWAMDYTLKSVADFTKPAHDRAQTESVAKRATVSMPEMRGALERKRAAQSAREKLSAVKRKAPRSAWKHHEDYVAAMEEAKKQEVAEPEARSRLFEIPDMRRDVKHVEKLIEDMTMIEEEHREEHRLKLAGMPDQEVRDAYQAMVRQDEVKDRVKAAFGSTSGDGWMASFWTLLFMLVTIMVVALGVSGGIERWCTILMPVLICLIVVMVLYGMTRPGFGAAVDFVFRPDPSKLSPSGVLEALGHAFFTLSLGMGAMITYGSYQKGKDDLIGQSVTIAGMDTAIALLACLMMFPIVFSYGQEPVQGPGLVFMSMPLAFSEIGAGGMLLSILFFGLLVFAALTSAISLLEVVASYFIDQKGWSRRKAAWLLGAAVFAFGLPSALSTSPQNPFPAWEETFGKNFFDTMDYLATNWLLPLGGLLIALYAGWVLPRRMRESQLEGAGPVVVGAWLILIRFVAPILVILVLLQKVEILKIEEILYRR